MGKAKRARGKAGHVASSAMLEDSYGLSNGCAGAANAGPGQGPRRNDKKKSKLLQDYIPLMAVASQAREEGEGDKPRSRSPPKKMRDQVPQDEASSSSSVPSSPSSLIAALETPSADSVSSGTGARSVVLQSNPLLMEDVMENVFKYILCQPAKKDVSLDLQNFRRVCKPWRNAATRLYRPSAPLMIFGNLIPQLQLAFKGRNSFPVDVDTFGDLRKFLQRMKFSEMIPFQSYLIAGSLNTIENQKLMEDFLRICGPTAVSLDFRFKYSGNFEGDFELGGFSRLDLPKLRTLFVEIDDHRGGYHSPEAHASVNFAGVVLNGAQELRELTFEFNLPEPMSNYNQSSMNTFEKDICQRIPKSVKILDMQRFWIDQTFSYLVERELKLEEFVFDPNLVLGGSEAIRSFLTNQSEHLKTLKIISSMLEEDDDVVILEFPLLHKLETLTLAEICVDPFSLGEKFPNLICLDVAQWKEEGILLEFLECAKKTAPSVKTIHLTHSPDFPMAPTIQRFAEYFPNITELRLDQDVCHDQEGIGSVLEEVFTHLTNLEELHITIMPFGPINLDSLFSGVPEEDCKRICRGGSQRFGHVDLAVMQRKQSMLNLTRLRKLVLKKSEAGPFQRLITLSEFSIYFVFLKLVELEELSTFAISTKSKISKTYLQRLKDKVKLRMEYW